MLFSPPPQSFSLERGGGEREGNSTSEWRGNGVGKRERRKIHPPLSLEVKRMGPPSFWRKRERPGEKKVCLWLREEEGWILSCLSSLFIPRTVLQFVRLKLFFHHPNLLPRKKQANFLPLPHPLLPARGLQKERWEESLAVTHTGCGRLRGGRGGGKTLHTCRPLLPSTCNNILLPLAGRTNRIRRAVINCPSSSSLFVG